MPKKRRQKQTADDHTPRVFVVGGGLAGMTAAKVLAEHGMLVTLLEKTDLLGGKAGSIRANGGWLDHGFHCFPAWYLNTRALLNDLGCEGHLTDIDRFHFLEKGAYPKFVTTYEFTPQNLLHNVFRGVLPWHENLLSYYCLLELACEDLRPGRDLDQISGTGFLRSRFYATESVANLQQQTILQAAAIPAYECSALTLQHLFRAWLKWPSPLYSILNGNLQEKFIAPFAVRLKHLGVDIKLRATVTDFTLGAQRVTGVTAKSGKYVPEVRPQDFVIVATPREVGFSFLLASPAARKQDASPDFLKFRNAEFLQSLPMSALQISLKRRLRDFPKEHINLVGSRWGITLVDISQHWDGLETTTLNAVAARAWPLRGHSEVAVENLLVDEILAYLPVIRRNDIEGEPQLQMHFEQPLFVNTVASWQSRPEPATDFENLFVAGDYCQTEADLATMESAVMSGISAAAAVLKRAGKRVQVTPLPIGGPSPLLLSLMRYAGLPVVAPIGLWKRLYGRIDPWVRAARGG